jgi:hypothetical protein
MISITSHPEGLSFRVHVQPGSSRNQVLGRHGDALKVKLTAPPVEGRANKACVEFLSDALGVPKSSLDIVAGQSSRLKHIRLRCSPHQATLVRKRLEEMGAR